MINVNELKEFLGCDNEFLAHLMETFIKESGEGIIRLKTAADSKNWQLVKATAHKMLSSTRIFNIGELSSVLEEIEKMAEMGIDTALIPGKVSAVEQSWKNVIEEIKILLPTLKE